MARLFWRKYDRDWGWNLARLLAFACLMGLFAVAGLELLVLALVLRLFQGEFERDVAAQLARLLPKSVAATTLVTFTHSLAHAPWPLLILGLPVAIWYGTRFFAVWESVLCVIFRRPKRRFLRQNRAALGMLLLFAILLPVIVLSVTSGTDVVLRELGLLPPAVAAPHRLASDPLFASVALVAGIAANVVLLLVAYTRLTPGGVAARHALPGALLGAVLAEGYLFIFPFYLRYVLTPDHYGTVAGFVLVALVFFFAYAVFAVVGAEVAALRAGYRPATGDVTELLAAAYAAHAQPVALPWRLEGRGGASDTIGLDPGVHGHQDVTEQAGG